MPPAICANPLLLEWIKEIYDLARERNSKGVTTYKRAYESMKACPLTFSHPSEAQQLDGIGPKICDRLTEKLQQHCEANGLPQPKKPRGKARKRLSTDDLAEVEEPAPAKQPRKVKAYVPTLRSGPYALILALSSMPEDSLQSLTKAQLTELAQPHCDSSFTVPSEAGKFYTAWNSMTTLVSKDLVQEKGRPLRKYTLTEEGWEVAKGMRAALEREKRGKKAGGPQTAAKTTSAGSSGSTAPISKDADEFLDLEGMSEEEGLSSRRPTLSKGTEVNSRNKQQRPESLGQRLDGSIIDRYGTFSMPRNPEITSKNIVELLSSPEREPSTELRWARTTFNQDTRPLTNEAITKPPTQSLEHNIITPNPQDPSITSSSLPTYNPITLQPGTFTIHLILDNREVRAKDDRDYISTELTQNGAAPLLRPLSLGDFFWVAKLHDPTFLSRYGEEGDEVILDWIVERKRLDDLVASITDGRFQEQKFRLRKSGIKNVVYLTEEFSLSQEKSTKFREAIQSAIASTQVVNGYFVKRTQKLDESIRYIARLTRMLKSLYEAKPLYLIPTSALAPTTYLPLLAHLRTSPVHKDKTYTITYNSFASLASKSDTLTLRDVFLKMLMCTRGISGNKALAIQKVWRTPREFIEAFEKCETQEERERMVESKLGRLVGSGKVKGTLGAKVAGVWGEP